MTIFTTVVTSLVTGSLGTISRDVSHFSAVEATTILGSSFVDLRPIISLQTRILAVSGDMTGLKRFIKRKARK
jgi:hypothetical protein